MYGLITELILVVISVALTNGQSVLVDLNGKPFMNPSGIVTQNVNSSWKILCDDNGDFHTNGLEIANDICNIIGFKSVKKASTVAKKILKLILFVRSARSFKVVAVTSINLSEEVDGPGGQIDIRSNHLRNKANVTKETCSALEISCVPFQSGSAAVLPIQLDKGKKNSTSSSQNFDKVPDIFLPVDPKDPSNVILKPGNKTETEHEWSHLRVFNWPWSAEIFVNGDLAANGILLDKSWVLAERSFLGESHDALHENHIVALLGNTKSHLIMQSPYEQLAKVDCIQFINDSNVILLHLESPIVFNRHVVPTFLPIA